MCGLSGIVSKKNHNHSYFNHLLKMTELIAHRGPDQAGYLNYENVLEQIENNSNLTDLGKLTYGWEGAKAMYRVLSYNEDIEKTSNWGGVGATIKNFGYQAIEDCERKALKRKLSGGKCLFVDFRRG